MRVQVEKDRSNLKGPGGTGRETKMSKKGLGASPEPAKQKDGTPAP